MAAILPGFPFVSVAFPFGVQRDAKRYQHDYCIKHAKDSVHNGP